MRNSTANSGKGAGSVVTAEASPPLPPMPPRAAGNQLSCCTYHFVPFFPCFLVDLWFSGCLLRLGSSLIDLISLSLALSHLLYSLSLILSTLSLASFSALSSHLISSSETSSSTKGEHCVHTLLCSPSLGSGTLCHLHKAVRLSSLRLPVLSLSLRSTRAHPQS